MHSRLDEFTDDPYNPWCIYFGAAVQPHSESPPSVFGPSFSQTRPSRPAVRRTKRTLRSMQEGDVDVLSISLAKRRRYQQVQFGGTRVPRF